MLHISSVELESSLGELKKVSAELYQRREACKYSKWLYEKGVEKYRGDRTAESTGEGTAGPSK